MNMKTRYPLLLMMVAMALLVSDLLPRPVAADQRTMTEEQQQAIANDGNLDEPSQVKRRGNLPDLTKGEVIRERLPQHEWHLGPTGIIGYIPGGERQGDQIEVTRILPGSPAEGKMQWGDVILGVAGKDFQPGSNVPMAMGKAIIEAEKEENQGKLKLKVWRDANFPKRFQRKDIAGTDVDRLIDRAVSDDSLYEWKSDVEQEREASSPNFKDFPIDAETIEVTLELEVMPPYSDTSPYDCPKTQNILENAWRVLEKQFKEGKIRANRSGSVAALALVASGKPEHRELVREWVRSPQASGWHPSIADQLDINKPGGFVSWRMSFEGLDCAIYYHATGDEFVLPAIRAYAMHTAQGQSGAGSWGHTFAWPSFNGGELHGMNPGYGALNAAGNRCFMLIALAQKLGIDDPAINEAVERSKQFFGSYYEKGAIPYGHHPAAASDDSNGKNVGVAFALKLLGDDERARWFAQMSNHASFTRRSGHANDYFWHYSPWAATLLGPKGTIASHRNLRWRFTLNRRHDGGFVNQSPTKGIEELRNATATFVLHYSAPFKQTLWTGKDADESIFWTDREYQQLLTMAQGQFNDETLFEQAGPRIEERSTDEVFDFLDVFKPKTRHILARELAKRYQAGETDILPRLVELLKSDNPRIRDAASHGIQACGRDAILQYMSQVIPLLKDEQEFVRMQAAKTIAVASDNTEAQKALLRATIDEDMSQTMGPNSLPNITQGIFIGNSNLAKSPFQAGLDAELVEAALEKMIVLDPTGNRGLIGSRIKVWDKDTVKRVAGPIIYTAEEEQIADQMFSSRRAWSLDLLERLGYQEAVDGSVSYLRKYEQLPRDVRQRVTYKRGLVDAKRLMRNPEVAKPHLPALKRWLADKPLDLAFKGSKEEPAIKLYKLIDAVEAAPPAQTKPSLADQAERLYIEQVREAGDLETQISLTREVLADPSRPNLTEKTAALSFLVEQLDEKAASDVLAYLAHGNWRVRQRAHDLAIALARKHGDDLWIDVFTDADDPTAAAILRVLAETQTPHGRQMAQRALQHRSPQVRGEALKTLVAIAGAEAIDTVFDTMTQTSDAAVLRGGEQALLSRRHDASFMQTVRERAMAGLIAESWMVRDSMLWLMAQAGGPEALATLKQKAKSTDEAVFISAINALSYSPDPDADEVMIEIIAEQSKQARRLAAAKHGVRRMVVSPEGPGERPIEQQLDYAEGVLNLVLDTSTITYLGRIQTGRAAHMLQRTMKRGEPASAAKAIIEATSDLSGAPAKDRELAEKALIDTIEFIEVTQLRGGATERDWRYYPMWKAIGAEAGKNLLKLTKSKKNDMPPPPAFDDLDLDI